MMAKKLVYPIALIMTIALLTGCHLNKTIEYDEEVKLSDGSMTWVHIKRHYAYASAIAQGEGYIPKEVEVSWDTGFPNVGRKSVFFDTDIYLIDKINNEWYVIGYRYPYEGTRKGIDATNCYDIGSLFNQDYMCLAVINERGEFVKKTLSDVEHIDFLKNNLLDPYDMKGWSKSAEDFKKLSQASLSWNDKFQMINSAEYAKLGKNYSFTQQEHPR